MLQNAHECYNKWNEHKEKKKALESEYDIYSHVTFPQINMELLICPSGKDLGGKI
jgi:hypothetical protein